MTSLILQKILEKLENFQEYLKYLHQLQQEAKDEKTFLADFHLFSSTERYLQLSIQIIIDISHLIIIDFDIKRPEDNYEAVFILCEKKIFSKNLTQKLFKMIGLRNVLVHEYGKIDRKEIYKILKTKTPDLEEFKKQIVDFLNKNQKINH
jgi:uncharacterized protein YutE (UPF0331/DUF86 family)